MKKTRDDGSPKQVSFSHNLSRESVNKQICSQKTNCSSVALHLVKHIISSPVLLLIQMTKTSYLLLTSEEQWVTNCHTTHLFLTEARKWLWLDIRETVWLLQSLDWWFLVMKPPLCPGIASSAARAQIPLSGWPHRIPCQMQWQPFFIIRCLKKTLPWTVWPNPEGGWEFLLLSLLPAPSSPAGKVFRASGAERPGTACSLLSQGSGPMTPPLNLIIFSGPRNSGLPLEGFASDPLLIL